MGLIHVVVGGQFGSEAKGHVTAWLTRELSQVKAVVRVAGPNAGHTAYDEEGRPFSLRQIPVAAVADPDVQLIIAAGSEIDPRVLAYEIRTLESAGHNILDRLVIDPQATIIEEHHLRAEGAVFENLESLVDRIGSTGKGIGAARADRIMRHARTFGQWRDEVDKSDVSSLLFQCARTQTSGFLHSLLMSGDIIVEGTQGYGLGLHAGFYPYCTSSDCRAIDFLAMAGLTPGSDTPVRIWPVFRTYPIRVAGNSGPLRQETSWDILRKRSGGYINVERTTVTQKVRRVGEWDSDLARHAMIANGSTGWNSKGIFPVLTFFDYLHPELAGVTDRIKLQDPHWESLGFYEAAIQHRIAALGTGPDSMISV